MTKYKCPDEHEHLDDVYDIQCDYTAPIDKETGQPKMAELSELGPWWCNHCGYESPYLADFETFLLPPL